MSSPPLLYSTYTTNPDATVDAHVLSLLSATSPLSYNSATGQFTIQQASGAQDGYLSSVDWNTFNSKQAPLTLPLSIANGGTNNTGPFTAGSVILLQRNPTHPGQAALFWDDTNKAFCVGTDTQKGFDSVVAQIGRSGCGKLHGSRPWRCCRGRVVDQYSWWGWRNTGFWGGRNWRDTGLHGWSRGSADGRSRRAGRRD